MSTEIALACQAGGTLSAVTLDIICEEFLSVLKENRPGLYFRISRDALPRIELTVTHANERGMGLEIRLMHTDSRGISGKALKTAFFDRNSDATLRRRFYTAFLTQNPILF